VKKIFITDNDPGMQEIYKIILKKEGYEVKIIDDAGAVFSSTFELPDLFLLDNLRGAVDGLQICRYLKSRDATRNIPVIVVSGTPGVIKLAETVGADAAIEKPFNKKSLLQTIASCLEKVNR
jgi:DNA-binding response OmpR family regulator